MADNAELGRAWDEGYAAKYNNTFNLNPYELNNERSKALIDSAISRVVNRQAELTALSELFVERIEENVRLWGKAPDAKTGALRAASVMTQLLEDEKWSKDATVFDGGPTGESSFEIPLLDYMEIVIRMYSMETDRLRQQLNMLTDKRDYVPGVE